MLIQIIQQFVDVRACVCVSSLYFSPSWHLCVKNQCINLIHVVFLIENKISNHVETDNQLDIVALMSGKTSKEKIMSADENRSERFFFSSVRWSIYSSMCLDVQTWSMTIIIVRKRAREKKRCDYGHVRSARTTRESWSIVDSHTDWSHFRFGLAETMRLFWNLLVLGLVLVPSAVSLGDGFTSPQLDNVESHISSLWKKFLSGYGIVYNTTVEEVRRFQIFTAHVKMIVKHNLEHDLGLHTYRLGVNKYAAMVIDTHVDDKHRSSSVFLSRPIQNFDNSSTVIVSRRIVAAHFPRYDTHISRLRPIALFPCQSIGVIKVWSLPWKIKLNVGHVGRSVPYA